MKTDPTQKKKKNGPVEGPDIPKIHKVVNFHVKGWQALAVV